MRSSITAAFNEGADARLAGVPAQQCPHPWASPEAAGWLRGWEECDKNWGAWVRGRWPVRRLPAVGERIRLDHDGG